jgi:hypothetical protein
MLRSLFGEGERAGIGRRWAGEKSKGRAKESFERRRSMRRLLLAVNRDGRGLLVRDARGVMGRVSTELAAEAADGCE